MEVSRSAYRREERAWNRQRLGSAAGQGGDRADRLDERRLAGSSAATSRSSSACARWPRPATRAAKWAESSRAIRRCSAPRSQPLGLEIASGWISLYFTEPGARARNRRGVRDALRAFSPRWARRSSWSASAAGSVQQAPLPVDAARPRFGEDDWRLLVDGLHRIGEMRARAPGSRSSTTPHGHRHPDRRGDRPADGSRPIPELVSLLVDSGAPHLRRRRSDCGAAPACEAGQAHPPEGRARRGRSRRCVTSKASFETAVRAGVFTVPGDGAVDMRGFLKAVHEIGYSGWMVVEAEQDPAKAPPLEYAKKGRAFVREVTGL